MEGNIISTVNLPSDTINITFEFIQPGSDEASENGAGRVILERTGDQFVEVIHCPSGSTDDPAVPVQLSSTNDISCSNREYRTQESLHSAVVQGIKTCATERKTSEKTLSNSSQMSISNPWQLSIANPPQSSISNPQQPSISNTQQRPSMINLRIQNGQVVERVYVKTPIQTQAIQKKKTSTTIPKRVRKTANNKNVEGAASEKEVGGKSNNEKVDGTPANNTLEGTQITNSTKLALRNFLKKKSMAKVNHETNGKSVDDNADQTVSITGEFEVSNGCDKDRAHSHQLSNIEKDGINVSAGTESQQGPELASIAESGSPNPVQSSANSGPSPNKSASTAVQNDNDQPSNEQLHVTGLNVDSTDKEINQGDNDATCTSDGASSSQITITQEVDVVVLPSLLQPNVSKNTAKTRAEKVPQQQTGIKKKKAKKHRVCAECGKTVTSHQYYEHMNIHYDRRPHKCTECGKAFRQSHHLAKHKLLHTGEKPFACQYCDRAFTSFYNRQDHERIHTGEKPCKCPHCGKMFRTTNMVKAHERNFHNLYVKSNLRSTSHVKSGTTMKEKRIYTCQICDKTFSWSSALSVHKKSHADACTYKCNKCSKAFKNYSSLWNHKRTHSKEKPFECDLCGQRLKRRGNLKRHILTQHEPEEAEQCLKTSKQFENFRAKKKIENK